VRQSVTTRGSGRNLSGYVLEKENEVCGGKKKKRLRTGADLLDKDVTLCTAVSDYFVF
jgi:hypothetical protein